MESSTNILDPSYEQKDLFQGFKDEHAWIKKMRFLYSPNNKYNMYLKYEGMSSGTQELAAGSQALCSDSCLHSCSQCGTSHEPRLLLVRSAAHLRQTRRFLSVIWDVVSVTDDHFFVIAPTLYYICTRDVPRSTY